MVAIIDYGVGNLFSLISSFKAIGEEVIVTSDKQTLFSADRIVLPGVGAFGDAVKKLKDSGLFDVVKELSKSGKAILGICLGMQLLFEESLEYGSHQGLGLIKGKILPIADAVDKSLKIPHIGWNALKIKKQSPLLKYVKDGEHVYFVHSYYGEDSPSVIATSEYGVNLCAIVQEGLTFGCQFHPEKSGKTGLNILKAFCEIGGNK